MMTPSTAPPGLTPGRIRWWRRLARVAVVHWRRVPRPARQLCVAVFGTGVLLAGVALIVLPGPAVLVMPLGLAILATEFPWARKLLDWAKAHVLRLKHAGAALLRTRRKRSPTPG
jgi:uncharacterized protein (TIGR02611 family)